MKYALRNARCNHLVALSQHQQFMLDIATQLNTQRNEWVVIFLDSATVEILGDLEVCENCDLGKRPPTELPAGVADMAAYR